MIEWRNITESIREAFPEGNAGVRTKEGVAAVDGFSLAQGVLTPLALGFGANKIFTGTTPQAIAWKLLFGAAAGAAIGGINAWRKGDSAEKFWQSVGMGAVSGAFSIGPASFAAEYLVGRSAAQSLLGSMCIGGFEGGLSEALCAGVKGESFAEALHDGAVGAAWGMALGGGFHLAISSLGQLLSPVMHMERSSSRGSRGSEGYSGSGSSNSPDPQWAPHESPRPSPRRVSPLPDPETVPCLPLPLDHDMTLLRMRLIQALQRMEPSGIYPEGANFGQTCNIHFARAAKVGEKDFISATVDPYTGYVTLMQKGDCSRLVTVQSCGEVSWEDAEFIQNSVQAIEERVVRQLDPPGYGFLERYIEVDNRTQEADFYMQWYHKELVKKFNSMSLSLASYVDFNRFLMALAEIGDDMRPITVSVSEERLFDYSSFGRVWPNEWMEDFARHYAPKLEDGSWVLDLYQIMNKSKGDGDHFTDPFRNYFNLSIRESEELGAYFEVGARVAERSPDSSDEYLALYLRVVDMFLKHGIPAKVDQACERALKRIPKEKVVLKPGEIVEAEILTRMIEGSPLLPADAPDSLPHLSTFLEKWHPEPVEPLGRVFGFQCKSSP